MSVHEYARRESPGNYVPTLKLYRVRLYARGDRRRTESVYARGLRSAVRLAEELNPGYTATVVEA